MIEMVREEESENLRKEEKVREKLSYLKSLPLFKFNLMISVSAKN